MIPQVIMVWAPKTAKCRYCNEDIEAGAPEVSAMFSKNTEEGKNWSSKRCYHPQCWIAAGLDYLKQHPYTPDEEKVELTDEQKAERQSILRKYASLRQRQRKLNTDSPRYHVLYANIEAQIFQLVTEIQPIGGVPKKWFCV